MQKIYHISLFSVFVFSNCIAMEQPATTATPLHPLHQQYANTNAEAYYEAVSRQSPSYLAQTGQNIITQSAVQVLSAVAMLGITSACSGIYYLVKGPTDEQREIEIMLTKNENTNRQNKTIIKKEALKVKREALQVKKEEREKMLDAIKDLYALPNEILSEEEKTQAKQEFLKTYLASLIKKQEQLPKLSADDLKAELQG